VTKFVASALAVLLTSGVAEAYPSFGTTACSGWTAHRREDPPGRPQNEASLGSAEGMMMVNGRFLERLSGLGEGAWVLGFVRGAEFAGHGDDPPVDTDDVISWVSDWCRRHPVENLEPAASQYISNYWQEMEYWSYANDGEDSSPLWDDGEFGPSPKFLGVTIEQ
jgi:hypothetical protein